MNGERYRGAGLQFAPSMQHAPNPRPRVGKCACFEMIAPSGPVIRLRLGLV